MTSSEAIELLRVCAVDDYTFGEIADLIALRDARPELTVIRERLTQHRDNLALWKSGALRPTVEDDEEQHAVMHELCVAIAELETVLTVSGNAEAAPKENKP